MIYRAVAKSLLDAGADLTDEVIAVSAALQLDPEKFGNLALKTQAVGDAASVVSAISKVWEVLLNFQRQFAADPPGAVLDGRDIGTVICPNADVKIFVVADPHVRRGAGRWKPARAAKRPMRPWCWLIFSSATSATAIARRPPSRRPPTRISWIIQISISRAAFAPPSLSSKPSAPAGKRCAEHLS